MQESLIFLSTPHSQNIKPEQQETFETQDIIQLLGGLWQATPGNQETCRQKFPATKKQFYSFIFTILRKLAKYGLLVSAWITARLPHRLRVVSFGFGSVLMLNMTSCLPNAQKTRSRSLVVRRMRGTKGSASFEFTRELRLIRFADSAHL